MSKPEIPGQPIVRLSPEAQLRAWVELYGKAVRPETRERIAARTRELGLAFEPEELTVLAALDTPARAQEFLSTHLYYNNDHASVEQDETVMPPRQVLRAGMAHCFEGALLAYTCNYLHGHEPRWVLLEASQDSDHNLVLYRDPRTGLYGANAHSRFFKLDGRAAEFPTIRALAESYYPYYHSDRTNRPEDLTLVGYSEPFDLIEKYGVEWMGADEPLFRLYDTYVDDTVRLHYLFDDSRPPRPAHPYPVIRALQEGWIAVETRGPVVRVEALPEEPRRLWRAFWEVYAPETLRPQGAAREIEQRFQKLTGTTPIDLQDNAEDLGYFLERGYRIQELFTRRSR